MILTNLLLGIIIVLLLVIVGTKNRPKNTVSEPNKKRPQQKDVKKCRVSQSISDDELNNKRERYDQLLDLKEKELLSDNAVFYRMKVNKAIFKKYASKEQLERLKDLQEKCKQEHRKKFSQINISRG